MERLSRFRPAITGVHDALAGPVGLSALFALLVFICVLAGLYVERAYRQLVDSETVFSDRYIRNGFASMNDIQRLLLVVQNAKTEGGFTPEIAADFAEATDFLYARVDHFRQSIMPGEAMDAAVSSVRSVEKILAVADGVSGTEVDVLGLWADLLPLADDARRNLKLFLDLVGRQQNEIMREQSEAVRRQRVVVLACMIGLTVVGVGALLLLRREVVARKARERAERDVEFLAYFDQLTQLPNRTQFQMHLAERLAANEPVALVLVDLDDFKIVNDTYGHAAGDAVLRHVAGLLSAQASIAGGVAARLGGDEFAMALPTDRIDSVTASLDALLIDARKGVSFEGETFRIGLSIGFANSTMLVQDLSPTLDTIFRVADFALYHSKAGGRGRYTQYDRALEIRYLERRAMVDELPEAVASGSLDVYLQPKVRLSDHSIYGFEALVRWRRNGGIVPPDEFIRIAEESGVIYEIDRYVLQAATSIFATYNRNHGTSYSVSVNLSALHFGSLRIVGWVREALDHATLEPGLLTLEITETAEFRDWREAEKIMSDLRRLGVKISIDDFGAGYSSLGYLRSTFVDEVKIDRSIVEQIETSDKARFLLDGVLDIAGNLGLDVVVEGVEDQGQADMLWRMGAKRAQGYLFGKPVAADQALGALRAA